MQPSREVILERRLVHITSEIIVGICTIVLTVIAVVDHVRSDKKK